MLDFSLERTNVLTIVSLCRELLALTGSTLLQTQPAVSFTVFVILYRKIYSIANAVKMVRRSYHFSLYLPFNTFFFTAHEVLRLTFHDAIGFSLSGQLTGTGADGSVIIFNDTELQDRES